MTATPASTSVRPPAPGASAPLAVRFEDGGLWIWDAACGRCRACGAGYRAACLEHEPGGAPGDPRWRRRDVAGAAHDLALLEIAALAHDLVGTACPSPIVLVTGPAAVAAAARAAASAAGARLAVAGADTAPDDLRAALAGGGRSGRADLVLAGDGDLAGAARHVRRGGAIGALVAVTSRPSVITLVQRELDVLVPRDLVRAALECDVSGVGS